MQICRRPRLAIRLARPHTRACANARRVVASCMLRPLGIGQRSLTVAGDVNGETTKAIFRRDLQKVILRTAPYIVHVC